MKIQTECVPCLLRRVIYEAELSTKDQTVKTQTVQTACKALGEIYDPNTCSAVVATKVHKLVYETLGDDDPYKDLKNQSNRIAQSLLPKVEALINESEDPVRTSMLCAIVGNVMDFGIEGGSSHPGMLRDIFDQTVNEGIGYDDTAGVKSLLQRSRRVMLFTDNCGEIVFDKVLCRELKKFNPDMFLTLVVRGEPIISDATLDDVKELQINEVVDEVLTTGCFAIGVDFNRLPMDLHKALKQADFILCKGMANYEAFSETEYHPIAYLLRTKCAPIADAMELPLNINAVKLYK